jgi:hypothetical protein
MDQQPSRIHRVGVDPSPSDHPTSGRFIIQMGGRMNGKTFFAHQTKAIEDLIASKKGATDAMSPQPSLRQHPVPVSASDERPVDFPLYARNGTFTLPVRSISPGLLASLGLNNAAIREARFVIFDRKTLFPLGAVGGSQLAGYRAYYPYFASNYPGYLMTEIGPAEHRDHESEYEAYRAVLGHAIAFGPTVYNDNREDYVHTSNEVASCVICAEPVEVFRMTFTNFARRTQRFSMQMMLHLDSVDGPNATPSNNPFVCVATHDHTYGPDVNGRQNIAGDHTPCPRCHQPIILTGSALVAPRHAHTGLDACAYVSVGVG